MESWSCQREEGECVHVDTGPPVETGVFANTPCHHQRGRQDVTRLTGKLDCLFKITEACVKYTLSPAFKKSELKTIEEQGSIIERTLT